MTGTQGATVVAQVGAVTAADVASGANLANGASSANTPNTLVRRDGNGDFAAGSVTLAGELALPASTDAGVGVISIGGTPALHMYGGNSFVGGSGNFTMSGRWNTANGFVALTSNTTGSQNTANGARALFSNTSGTDNTANGYAALESNTEGWYNTANGSLALGANTTGSGNTANGSSALGAETTGDCNTAHGGWALHSNTTGNNNIALAYEAGSNLTTGDNNIDIGNGGVAGGANTIRIGTPGTHTTTYLAGDVYGVTFTPTSDRNAKEDLEAVEPARVLEKVAALPISTWRFKQQAATRHIGPMAQDFYAAFGLLALAVTVRAQSYAIDWSMIDGGGGVSTGGGYSVTGTIGQGTAGGSLTDGLYSVTGGFGTGPVTAAPPTAAGLAYFHATGLPGGRVVLTWGTLVEFDTLGFRVERSTPGGAWEPVSAGIVPAEGSDERPHDYRFEEATPAGSGGLMYRLVVIDVRGDERVLAEALVGSAVEVVSSGRRRVIG